MKSTTYNNKGSRTAWSPNILQVKALIVGAMILGAGTQFTLQAQEVQYSRPAWKFGAAAGANLNFNQGLTQQLNSSLTVPAGFNHGNGVGLFLGPVIEYHRPGSRFGMMLQGGFDSRKSTFDQITTPCNCPADLSTDLSYLTVEPSLRFAPFKNNFYLYAGPRFAFNRTNAFTYQLGINPDFQDQAPTPAVNGEFSNTNQTLVSMQIGAGHDIQLSSQNRKIQTVLSPFVAIQPYFGQNPRSSETWTLTTLRVGAALKFGKGRKIPVVVQAPAPAPLVEPVFEFAVNSPKNDPEATNIIETFPIRNYVYFNADSPVIPNRYVTLEKNQVVDFKADQLDVFAPKELSGRANRQLMVYYNVLNILGDRMVKHPATRIKLVGSSEKGSQEGRNMSESVKNYLTNTWGIDASRIATEGLSKPRIPSKKAGGTRELDVLLDGDRRVSIESSSPELLMEFKGGLDAALKPVSLVAPEESYVTFNVDGAADAFSSWALEVKDSQGNVQNFGPYTEDKVSIAGESILGTKPEGDYTVTMVGQSKDGQAIRKETPVKMVLWTPPTSSEGNRFSVIYEFNDAKAIASYEKFLTDVVAPKIPKGGTVTIQGHTDTIGEEAHNLGLSLARANDVKGILEKSLSKAGRTDVKFVVNGFGEDEKVSPFKNKFPEERAYNRTVIIDITPGN
ncbi:OmpA family protein [Algoriphagus sp. D3-2-R+10]|uniref:OmpA family protein n=1 Tax=Algoriphagus aurantiacus TaxID=3103948 RepID=UPI002B3BE469|nr:OmpA family protein [Algoriphagus sp. D3-2-R+10]MEB2774541.1 OmpA family protein [Algoriphagus sp. D3-2-R+10]